MPSHTNLSRRQFSRLLAQTAALSPLAVYAQSLSAASRSSKREFDVREFGARGNGIADDTEALQRAIDAAAAVGAGSRVIVPGGKKYLCGTLELRSEIEFHLADDAEILVSPNPERYRERALLLAHNAVGLKISGTGNLNGRAREFMSGYDEVGEWWKPKTFRPRMFALDGCHDLEVRDLSFSEAPSWGLHLLGCEQVLVDGLRIRNLLDVPNCDGIDPDHCRDVEIRNCHIVCGDDAIVIKSTREGNSFGASARISVHDCTIETQDSGLKIGTETAQTIESVRFERCKILSSCRGLTIQLRDEGDVRDILFSDIEFVSRYHSDPWWGRGEAISFTALPRTAQSKLGRIEKVLVRNVTGRAENSIRVDSIASGHVRDIRFENVDVTFDRWTRYKGGVFDNRPTSAVADLPTHPTVGFCLRNAEEISLKNCRVSWGSKPPDYFGDALQTENVIGLHLDNFVGEPAHPRSETSRPRTP